MKNILSLFMVLLITNLSFSQQNIAQDRDYVKFKKESIDFFTSDEYIEAYKIQKEFLSKVSDDYFYKKEDFDTWIKNNIQNTKFISEEEAIRENKEFEEKFYGIRDKETTFNKKRVDFENKYGKASFQNLYKKDIGDEITKILINRI